MSTALAWQLCAFDELGVGQLYALLQLRSEVFVVEQHCAFQDLDGLDAGALHLSGTANGVLLGYARCLPAGLKYEEASVGRVVTRASARGAGCGHVLIDRAIQSIGASWGAQPIRIGAQARLKPFYEGHGFCDMGLPYLEDGIEHIEMVWRPS